MPRIRRDIWKLGSEWDDVILWYARGVGAVQKRPIDDVTSWRYIAAMHGISEGIWRAFGYLNENETVPQTGEFHNFDKDQCQHHNWYFLPWHRGYLAAFEAIIRQAIIDQGGPADWALPYWNYSDRQNANARTFPPAFAARKMPDGTANPLYTPRRFGIGNGTIVLRAEDVDLGALIEDDFDGDATGGSPGFGGAPTPFQHNADRRAEGFIEQVPHDVVHGAIGGSRNNSQNPLHWGLMSNPATAALDPIFWLHHANIDRLWTVWQKRDGGRSNPEDTKWLDGPSGPRTFIMPQPDGTRRQFTARDMLDTEAPALDYVYEDVSDPLGGGRRRFMRLERLKLADVMEAVPDMSRKPAAELMGANAEPVQLTGKTSETSVQIDRRTAKKVTESFKRSALLAAGRKEPDRIFLNLENITGVNDAARFDVYVGLAPDADPQAHPENFAGVVSLFGVSEATLMNQPHGGNGLSKVLEITEVIDRLHLAGDSDLTALPVRFVAVNPPATDGVEIGRVSIYRQGR
jgi:tyrosinase